jgi:hypothetical protein
MTGLDNTTLRRLSFFMIIIGLLFATDSIFHLSFVYKFWPVIVAILGCGFVGIYLKRKPSGKIVMAAGEYLICFSAMALYCNFTSWSHLTSLWPLFIAFLGIIILTIYFSGNKQRLLLFSGLILVSLSIYFALVFSVSGELWWTIFLFVGASILLSGGQK